MPTRPPALRFAPVLVIVALAAGSVWLVAADTASDRNRDGRVDSLDLLLLTEEWHSGQEREKSGAGDFRALFQLALDWHRPLGEVSPTPQPSPTATATPLPTPVAALEYVVVSPRLRDASPDDVFDETYHGEAVVGIGQKVYLSGTARVGGPFAQHTWTVVAAPLGSTAGIEGEGELIAFRPDLEGEYRIRLVGRNAAGQAAPAVEARVFAARFVGTGSLGDNTPNVGEGQCAVCHPGNHTDWLKTNHANVMQEFLAGKRGAAYNLAHLPYHTVGYNPHPGAGPSQGFVQTAAANQFDSATIPALVAEAAAAAADPEIPDVSNFDVIPAPVQNKMSVQCESCHGPANRHFGNRLNINPASYDQRRCAVCHDTLEPGPLSTLGQWDHSRHPFTSSDAEGSVQTNATCRPCHTAEGFVEVQVEGGASRTHDRYHAITCAACHDPHGSSGLPNQLRRMGPTALPSGHVFTYAGKGGLCVGCHHSRVSDATATATGSFRGAHYGTQSDMLLGVSGYTYGQIFGGTSVHAYVVLDTCVACHMKKSDDPALGGHSFALRDDPGTPHDLSDDRTLVEGLCTNCHTGLSTLDRLAGAADWDGNGRVEGTQSEVRGLLAILREELLALVPALNVSEQGLISVPSAAVFSGMTLEEKAAVYNHRFVFMDGSYGVHNTGYAVMLLQESYRQLTGRPVPGAVVVPLGETIPWKTRQLLSELQATPGALYRDELGGAGISPNARKALRGVFGSLE